MAQFRFRAMDANGKDFRGELEAASADEAAKTLKADDLFPMRITAVDPAEQVPGASYMGHLAGPPRDVPLSTRAHTLFGGISNQFGWAFLGFGMIFFWPFAMQADVAGLWRFAGELATAPGAVTRCLKTNAKENNRRIYELHYTFTHQGQTYEGVSYATGQRRKPGARVTVEFPKGEPGCSRIQGMRQAKWPLFVLFVLLFPLVGLGFVLFNLSRGAKALHLLKCGQSGAGTLVAKEATSMRVNKRVVYKLIFEFQTDDGATHQATAKSHTPEVLEDEEQEPLLYDPSSPTRAVMLDALPGAPRIDAHGQIRAGRVLDGLTVLILPTATLVGHGLYAWFAYLS